MISVQKCYISMRAFSSPKCCSWKRCVIMEPLETCRKVWERKAGENTRQEEWTRKEKPDEKREDKRRSSMNKDRKIKLPR